MIGAVHSNLAPTAKVGGAAKEDTDPICLAAKAFRDGFADYNANAPNDDAAALEYAAKSYRPPRLAIVEWNQPARSLEGAVAALRLARDAGECDDFAMVGPMVQAALSYFETSV